MKHKPSERGQAIVLIALAIVGLVGLTGLSVDMGVTFANRRQAQNAADNAALSTALLAIRDTDATQAELETNAENIMRVNGLDPDDGTVTVTVNRPPADGTYADCSSSDFDCNEYIQIIINTEVSTYFAPVVGVNTMQNTVEAVARAKLPTETIPFDGAAIVALDPSQPSKTKDCGISANSAAVNWYLVGGGIFSNGCAHDDKGKVVIPNDKCVGAVGTIHGFPSGTCKQTVTPTASTLDEIIAMTPPEPPCDNTAEGGYVVPSSPSSFTFENGIYCVSNFDAFDGPTVILSNATLYITDTDYNIKLSGNDGGFMGTAYNSGTGSIYDNYYMIIAPGDHTCPAYNSKDQTLVLRGNGTLGITGSIWAPTACIDVRGNGLSDAFKSQIVAWKVTSNGSGFLSVNYNPDENAHVTIPPLIELAE